MYESVTEAGLEQEVEGSLPGVAGRFGSPYDVCHSLHFAGPIGDSDPPLLQVAAGGPTNACAEGVVCLAIFSESVE